MDYIPRFPFKNKLPVAMQLHVSLRKLQYWLTLSAMVSKDDDYMMRATSFSQEIQVSTIFYTLLTSFPIENKQEHSHVHTS